MKTIKTDTHLLLVDETAKIKGGDKILNPTNEIQTVISLEKGIGTDNICWIKVKETTKLQQILNSDKIIAASPKLGDLPEFETLPPNTEDDIEKLAKKLNIQNNAEAWIYNQLSESPSEDNEFCAEVAKDYWIAGYKQAKSETMFSLKQVKQAINCAFVFSGGKDENETYQDCEDFCLEQVSLTKPKEYEFLVEYIIKEKYDVFGILPENQEIQISYSKQPKIIKNKIQGVWKEIN